MMECLMHQVLVAMLTVTPAPDANATQNRTEIKAKAAIVAPAKAGRHPVVLGKKTKGGTQLAQVTLPRPAAVN